MSNKQQKKQRFIRIMAWILAILMVGALGTTIISFLIYFLSI